MNTQDEKTFVIAGSISQFKDYLRAKRLDPGRYRYMGRLEDIRGIHLKKVLLVGTYWNNPIMDYFDIVEDRVKNASGTIKTGKDW